MAGAGKHRGKQAKYQAAQPAPPANAPAASQPAPAAFDGPADPRGPGSASGASATGPPAATGQSARSPSGVPNVPGPQLTDPARDPPRGIHPAFNRNVDLPGNAYNLFSQMPTTLMPRPGFSTAGKPAQVSINSHKVLNFPTKMIYQYDVTIGNGAEKRALIKAVWGSRTVTTKLGQGWLFDGNKLAWAMSNLGEQEVRVLVDLDAERGQTSREGHNNTHRVVIRKTSSINMHTLQAYLDGQCQFNNVVLEAINFLDHLLRETPSKSLINIKRSYFHRFTQGRTLLGGGVEAMKGVYQSMRPAQGKNMVVNIDVSNSLFWHETSMLQLALQLTRTDSYMDMTWKCKPVDAAQSTHVGLKRESPYMGVLRRLVKNHFIVMHRMPAGVPDPQAGKLYKIHRISEYSANTFKFQCKNRKAGTVEEITVFEYFKRRYNHHLEWPDLPLLETAKGSAFPLEVCVMGPGQRYPYKLDEIQTAKMIKFAVSRPEERLQNIKDGLKILDWTKDPFLKNYGLEIDPVMLKTDARVLNPPEVLFGKGQSARPGFSGRWDLRGKQFLTNNGMPLKSWGVCVISDPRGGGMTDSNIKAFIDQFISVYRSHGGLIANTSPTIIKGITDIANASLALYNATGNAAQMKPQMFMWMLPNRSAEIYKRIKKNCDCRWGVVSQCVLSANVLRNQGQYHSNVCMKFNAKLGGTTCRVKMQSPSGHFKVPTMVIGADVSHAAPGSMQPSMAAMTVSMDAMAARYAASCQTNGHRREMIATRNIEDMLQPLFMEWSTNIGRGRMPEHIYYFRDGVSEGQYQNLLTSEVADVKRLLMRLSESNPAYQVKFTVVVAEKRHHIRFFPPQGPAADRNRNPVPGVLVEKDVTHPYEYDFYLCSHSAIQGTARPTHYHILMDEMQLKPDEFQTMLYEHSYQYMRATTPVSLFPAVYYAHLASNRAAAHEDISQDTLVKQKSTPSSGEQQETETKPLLKFPQTPIRWTMWYI